MVTVHEREILPLLSDAARTSEPYNQAMQKFYDGVCGTYPNLLPEVTAAAARDPRTLASKFRIMAQEELCGARILARAAKAVRTDSELQRQMKAHADDEYRHSRMFHALVETVLPGATAFPVPDTDAEEELGENFDDVEGFLISIHLAEIRSQIIVSEFKKQIELSGVEMPAKVVRALEVVLADESRHIHYTSAFVADWIGRDRRHLDKLLHYIPIYDGFWWTHIELLSGSLSKSAPAD